MRAGPMGCALTGTAPVASPVLSRRGATGRFPLTATGAARACLEAQLLLQLADASRFLVEQVRHGTAAGPRTLEHHPSVLRRPDHLAGQIGEEMPFVVVMKDRQHRIAREEIPEHRVF